MAWGLGPVFDAEMKINARRWQVYAGRSFFVFALLIGMVMIWWSYLDASWSAGIRNQAKIGEAYYDAMVGVQLALTMIVAPAATAGAVCVERSRGSLAHMLVTDLTTWEIILGKLSARLLPTFALIACAWPVAALGSLLGGINPGNLTMAFAITLAVGLLGCSMALALSAWSKSVHEVLMAVYTFWAVVLLAYPIAYSLAFSYGRSFVKRWMLTANPFWLAFAPYIDPGKNGPWEYGCFFGVALGFSVICILLAMLGVRVNPLGEARPKRKVPVGLSRLGRLVRKLPGPSLDGNPVFWREWNRGRVSRPLRILMASLVLASGTACIHGAYEIFTLGYSMREGIGGVMAALFQTIFGMLMLGVLASLTFSEERRRGNLDVLLATPLSTRSIVLGKWLGSYRIVPLLAIGPGLVCWALAQDNLRQFLATQPAGIREYYNSLSPQGRILGAVLMPLTILTHGALIVSLALALSVWIRRESQAISLVVATYVLYSIGMPFAVFLLAGLRGGNATGDMDYFLAGSPVMVVLQLFEVLSKSPPKSIYTLMSIAFWDILAAIVAKLLFEATVRTFDRRFDRVLEHRGFEATRGRYRERKGSVIEVAGPVSDQRIS